MADDIIYFGKLWKHNGTSCGFFHTRGNFNIAVARLTSLRFVVSTSDRRSVFTDYICTLRGFQLMDLISLFSIMMNFYAGADVFHMLSSSYFLEHDPDWMFKGMNID